MYKALTISSRTLNAIIKKSKLHEHTVQAAVIEEKRTSLLRRVTRWSRIQMLYMPSVENLDNLSRCNVGDPSDVPVESLKIFLPSSLPSADRQSLYPPYDLVKKEIQFRLAQAEDSLSEIRKLLCRRAQGYIYKRSNVEGVTQNTRAQTVLQTYQDKIDRAFNRYTATWRALKTLNPSGDWKLSLRELLPDHLMSPQVDSEDLHRQKTSSKKGANRNYMGQGREELSWIWLVRRPYGEDMDEIDEATVRAGKHPFLVYISKSLFLLNHRSPSYVGKAIRTCSSLEGGSPACTGGNAQDLGIP